MLLVYFLIFALYLLPMLIIWALTPSILLKELRDPKVHTTRKSVFHGYSVVYVSSFIPAINVVICHIVLEECPLKFARIKNVREKISHKWTTFWDKEIGVNR